MEILIGYLLSALDKVQGLQSIKANWKCWKKKNDLFFKQSNISTLANY